MGCSVARKAPIFIHGTMDAALSHAQTSARKTPWGPCMLPTQMIISTTQDPAVHQKKGVTIRVYPSTTSVLSPVLPVSLAIIIGKKENTLKATGTVHMVFH